MGELIYCKRPLAAAPFFIEDSNLNIYSLEELSYYILNNVYLINADFMSTELLSWIGREAGDKELKAELLKLKTEGASLHTFIERILLSNGYLTKKEIKNVVSTISSFENKTESELRKVRGDRLLLKKHYVEAIHEYECILLPERLKDEKKDLEGDIRHNLGVAYARLFFYEEAAKSFEKAYLKNHRVASLMQLLLCFKLMGRDDLLNEYKEKYHVPGEQINNLEKRLEAIEGAGEIDLSFTNDRFKVKKRIEDLKEEYAVMSGI